MAVEMFSDDWARTFGASINANPAYREAAAAWEWPLVLSCHAAPDFALPEPRAIHLDLWHGECRAARAATPQDLETAPYVLAADVRTWKQVVDGRLDPVMGIMSGKLKLTRGKVSALLGFVKAAKELVGTAARVETAFPPGLA